MVVHVVLSDLLSDRLLVREQAARQLRGARNEGGARNVKSLCLPSEFERR